MTSMAPQLAVSGKAAVALVMRAMCPAGGRNDNPLKFRASGGNITRRGRMLTPGCRPVRDEPTPGRSATSRPGTEG